MRCVHISNLGEKTMDRGWYWDPPLNPLPAECSTCGYPDVEYLPRRYYLNKSRATAPGEIAIAAMGNFLVRERIHQVLKAVAPGTCRFRATYYQGTSEKTSWVLAVPKHQLETARIKTSIARCPECRQPKTTNSSTQYGEWYHVSQSDPAYGRKGKGRNWRDPGTHTFRYAACRETDYEIFKSAQWSSIKEGVADWNNLGRNLFFSVRLWELLKRIKAKASVFGDYREGAIKPDSDELEWVERKLDVLRRREIPLVPPGKVSAEDDKWLRNYIKQHAGKGKRSTAFASFEKKNKFKLPKSYKDFIAKIGQTTFCDVDGEEGFSAHILPPGKFDCKSFRRGQVGWSGESRGDVDGVMFASTGHFDCFCFDVNKQHKEYAVVWYNHEYDRFEPYASGFAACIKRFSGG